MITIKQIYLGSTLLITSSFFLSLLLFTPVSANPVIGFQAGRIMDDTVFTNKDTMSAQQIQAFLEARVPICDTFGTKPSEFGGGTRAQWAAARGYSPPFTCLRDFSENGKRASQIIYEVSQQFSINPQVLIVLLQKEQSLITDDWPIPGSSQYRTATGYGCPDTAPCDEQYFGLTNQLTWSARMFRAIMNQSPTWFTPYVVGNNYIQFSPNTSCGGSIVNIQNRATQALYNYTPYQPNQASLDAGWGSAACGAYGNRNFYLFFTSWFGPTYYNNFETLTRPRWMQVKRDGAQKVDVMTLSGVGETFQVGRQLRFIDKIEVLGKWYLRTEFNNNDGGLFAIPQQDLEEIPYTPIEPRWVTITVDANRSHPASRTSVGGELKKGTSVRVVEEITINGNLYYRTEFNKNNSQDVGIHSRFTSGFMPVALDGPRNFCSNSAIDLTDPTAGSVTGVSAPGTYFVTRKTLVNGVWYFQDQQRESTNIFFVASDLRSACFEPFENPRELKLSRSSLRFNPYSNQIYDTLERNRTIKFSSKILLDNQWYFRTENNTLNGIEAVVSAKDLVEI